MCPRPKAADTLRNSAAYEFKFSCFFEGGYGVRFRCLVLSVRSSRVLGFFWFLGFRVLGLEGLGVVAVGRHA